MPFDSWLGPMLDPRKPMPVRIVETGINGWNAFGASAAQTGANEAYKVLRSLGLAPFAIGIILLSAINKAVAEMDPFHRPPYRGPLAGWGPLNAMNTLEGTLIDEWNPVTTASVVGPVKDWDSIIWAGAGFPGAWNPIEVVP